MVVKSFYTDADNIPTDWMSCPLIQIADFENGKAHEQFIDPKGEYIVVNSKFISTEGRVAKHSNKNLSPLSKGDLTIVMSDIPNGKALAKCFYIPKENAYTLNQRIGCLKPHHDIDNDYLFYQLNRNKYFLSFDSGAGQTNLKKNEVLACPIPLPPNKVEQKLISSAIKNFDILIVTLQKLIKKKLNIKSGITQKLLSPKANWSEKTFNDLADKKVNWSITGGPFGSNLKASDYTKRVLELYSFKTSAMGNLSINSKYLLLKKKPMNCLVLIFFLVILSFRKWAIP
jgi:type I restriction enzyme S subunit